MLTWFAQELFSSCVAACVRMALNRLGAIHDEAQVRQLIGHTRSGVSLVAAQARLAQAGAAADQRQRERLPSSFLLHSSSSFPA